MKAAAVCQQCGAPKRAPLIPCKKCQFVPSGDERAIAWLLSREYLSETELSEASRRITEERQRPDPSQALIYRAKESMGALDFEQTQNHPLSNHELWALGIANFLLTPLTGLAVWHGLQEERPRAANQALKLTVPIAVTLALVWVGLIGQQISNGTIHLL